MENVRMSTNAELLGVVQKQSKNGNVYYIFNLLDENGTPFSLCCKDSNLTTNLEKRGVYIFELAYKEDRFGKKIEIVGVSPWKKH